MGFYTICFSPTGGTKKVTDILTKPLGTVTAHIDLVSGRASDLEHAFTENDICVVSVPSFAGRVPAIAAERLQEMKGNGARAILVVVYGNRAIEDTLLELKNIVAGRGFRPVAAVSAVAEHSIMHVYGTGRPDVLDEKELTTFADKIAQVLRENSNNAELWVPGNFPYKELKGGGMKPKAGEDCTKCGLCAKECPVGAIPIENPAAVEEEKCVSCMHCISVCPQHARKNDATQLAALIERLRPACTERKPNELFL